MCLSKARGQLHKPIFIKTPTTVLRLQKDLEQMTIPVIHCLTKFKINKRIQVMNFIGEIQYV